MVTFISLLILAIVISVLAVLYRVFRTQREFFTHGLDIGFKFSEIRTLWQLAQETNLNDPFYLFDDIPVLNDCISKVIMKARRNNTENSKNVQNFLNRLYKFRTRLALKHENSKGLDSTLTLDSGQRIKLILPGKGVFSSTIVEPGRDLIITMPTQKDVKFNFPRVLPNENWEGKTVSLYLWRKGDACYTFDTDVIRAGSYIGQNCLFLKHCYSLERSQKRHSIRCDCNVNAQAYIISSETVDFSVVEREPGYKCIIEDISEDGALIRIGGRGKKNTQIKLQFTINETFIMMYGIVRGVEYNQKLNQSRLHFECVHIDSPMKNAILSHIYKINPEEDGFILTEEEIEERNFLDDFLLDRDYVIKSTNNYFGMDGAEGFDSKEVKERKFRELLDRDI